MRHAEHFLLYNTNMVLYQYELIYVVNGAHECCGTRTRRNQSDIYITIQNESSRNVGDYAARVASASTTSCRAFSER